jgi:L-lactate dehydrogenase (cytochrome)
LPNFGNLVQFEYYQSMFTPPSEDRLPVAFEEWEARAKEKLDAPKFDYIAGGAGAGDTMRANRRAFDRWQIVPRMLRDVSDRDLSVTLFGQTLPYPILLAPIGVQSIIHPDGELAAARAAASLGVPFIASTAATEPLEAIAEACGSAPRWFQLYWSKDPDVTASFLRRAERAGYSAIVVTLDTPMMAWRERDLEHAYLPFLLGEGIGNYLTDPAFRSKLSRPPEEDLAGAVAHWVSVFGNPGLTWEDLAFLREHTRLPVLLKGILHPDDAELAIRCGMDGIIVSNHGGRQVDGAVAALDALVEVCRVVRGRVPVLMDSGIRRGADIVKALSLGADAVLIGRPYAYGLAVAGETGVRQVLRNLIADLDLTLALSGRRSVKELDPSVLVPAR